MSSSSCVTRESSSVCQTVVKGHEFLLPCSMVNTEDETEFNITGGHGTLGWRVTQTQCPISQVEVPPYAHVSLSGREDSLCRRI
jgi:hypothetical protein